MRNNRVNGLTRNAVVGRDPKNRDSLAGRGKRGEKEGGKDSSKNLSLEVSDGLNGCKKTRNDDGKMKSS